MLPATRSCPQPGRKAPPCGGSPASHGREKCCNLRRAGRVSVKSESEEKRKTACVRCCNRVSVRSSRGTAETRPRLCAFSRKCAYSTLFHRPELRGPNHAHVKEGEEGGVCGPRVFCAWLGGGSEGRRAQGSIGCGGEGELRTWDVSILECFPPGDTVRCIKYFQV